MDTPDTPSEPDAKRRRATDPNASDAATGTPSSTDDATDASATAAPASTSDVTSETGADATSTTDQSSTDAAAEAPSSADDAQPTAADADAAGMADEPPPGGSPPPPPPGGGSDTGGSGSGGATPPPPPRPPRTRQLTRRSRDRVIAGVAGGLGDYFNVDPAIFRLAFVGLMFIGGAGLPLYGIAWLFLPDRDSGRSVGDGLLSRFNVGNRSAGRIILALLVVIILANSSRAFGGEWLWAAILIGLGFLLFRDSDDEEEERRDPPGSGGLAASEARGTPPHATPSQPPGATPATDAASFEARSTNPYDDAYYSDLMTVPPPPRTDDGWRPTPLAEPPTPPPPPSILGRVTVAAVLIVVGAVALLESVIPAFDVATATYVAVALAIVGGGLVVGARWGRARGLIVLGAVLIIVLAASTAVPDVPTGVGQRLYVPENVSELADEYQLGMGEMQIDLTRLELEPDEAVSVKASTTIGSLQVVVPEGATIEGRAEAQVGTVDVLDRTSDGTPATLTIADEGDVDGATIDLDLSAVLGEIEVHRSDERGRAIRPPAEGI